MPAPIKTPQWPASTDAILLKSIGQCILIALASEGGRGREAAAQIAPCTVVPFSLQHCMRRAVSFWSHSKIAIFTASLSDAGATRSEAGAISVRDAACCGRGELGAEMGRISLTGGSGGRGSRGW